MCSEECCGKRLLLAILLLVFTLGCTAFVGAQNVKVAVVEFVEENDIGLENAQVLANSLSIYAIYSFSI